jgi:hypothetical protein
VKYRGCETVAEAAKLDALVIFEIIANFPSKQEHTEAGDVGRKTVSFLQHQLFWLPQSQFINDHAVTSARLLADGEINISARSKMSLYLQTSTSILMAPLPST